jgi:hypothetical protein
MVVTLACGGSIAYFLMPPRFSFQVANFSDIATLTCYGIVGLVLGRPARRESADNSPSTCNPDSTRRNCYIDLGALNNLLSPELCALLSVTRVPMSVHASAALWPGDDVIPIVTAAIRHASGKTRVQRISVEGGKRPGQLRLTVTAHYTWPTPSGEVIRIGKADQKCDRAEFLYSPGHIEGTWFDNGYSYIYQFTAEAGGLGR